MRSKLAIPRQWCKQPIQGQTKFELNLGGGFQRGFGAGELALIQVRVDARLVKQLGVRAALNDAPILHNEDLVGFEDRRKTMRDDDRSASRKRGFERLLDSGF